MRDDPFDPNYVRSLEREVLAPILDHYFRARLLRADILPARGPLVLAVNHSGNAFPYDAIALDAALWRRDGLDPPAKFRSTYFAELSLTWWMRPFGIDDFWRRAGAVDLTCDNFDRLLDESDRVIYYPEGVAGIGKGFHRRYRLQPFHTTFARLAACHRCPIYPVYSINAEWIVPFSFTWKRLDRVMQRVFGVPFLPLPWSIVAIVFPWAWFLAMPASLVFVVGDPIDVAARAKEIGVEDPASADPATLRRITESIRAEMQVELNRLAGRFGRQPYRVASLLRELWRGRRRLWRILPICWPVSFLRHERDRQRPPARSRVHAVLRDWDLLAFYLPLGWPLLSIVRALRRPPCGYRGLGRREAKRRQGSFRWTVSADPPPDREGSGEQPDRYVYRAQPHHPTNPNVRADSV